MKIAKKNPNFIYCFLPGVPSYCGPAVDGAGNMIIGDTGSMFGSTLGTAMRELGFLCLAGKERCEFNAEYFYSSDGNRFPKISDKDMDACKQFDYMQAKGFTLRDCIEVFNEN